MFITTYFPAKGETAEQFTPQLPRGTHQRQSVNPSISTLSRSPLGSPTSRSPINSTVWRAFFVGDSALTRCRRSKPGSHCHPERAQPGLEVGRRC